MLAASPLTIRDAVPDSVIDQISRSHHKACDSLVEVGETVVVSLAHVIAIEYLLQNYSQLEESEDLVEGDG
jgi:hypothetical protein